MSIGLQETRILLLFYTLGIYSRGRFKEWWKWLKGYNAQSVQSGTGRLSCSRTALKHCTSTETRWYKWLVSLVSPEIEEILLPRSFRSRTADALKTPKVYYYYYYYGSWLPNVRVVFGSSSLQAQKIWVRFGFGSHIFLRSVPFGSTRIRSLTLLIFLSNW